MNKADTSGQAVRRPASFLAAWTLLVWGLRTRNIIIDGDTAVGAVVPVICFLAGAAVLVAWIVRGSGGLTKPWAAALAAVGLFGIGYWLIRSSEIAFDDHSVAFIVVHAVLAVGTVVLSSWLLRTLRAWWIDGGIAAAGYGLAGAGE